MSLRIIAGEFGGRLIDAPPRRRTRPTADKVREAWFSALGSDVVGARVADLFAGSGALGLEALSRGAAHVHFVEVDWRTVEVVRRNVEALELDGRAQVVRSLAHHWIDSLAAPLDIVLADPPYGSPAGARIVERFRIRPFAAQLWVEHRSGAEWAGGADWSRTYGDTCLSRFRPPAPARPAISRQEGGAE